MAVTENLLNGKKVKLQLVGLDSNIFAVMGAIQSAARRQGWTPEEIKTVIDAMRASGSYDSALCIAVVHCEDPEKEEEDEDDEDFDEDFDELFDDDDEDEDDEDEDDDDL